MRNSTWQTVLFENMTFMYVLMCDDRYFFSRKVIIKPNDVHTSNDAKRYF